VQARLPVEGRGSTVVSPRIEPFKQADESRIRPGDEICGQCGYGNEPSKHFCRHCGAELNRSEPAVDKSGRHLKAGQLKPGRSMDEERSLSSVLGSLARWLALLVGLTALAGYAFVTPVREQVNAAISGFLHVP
jgi:hypothetical protein